LQVDEDSLNGSWLGGAFQLDVGHFRPYSEFFEIDSGKMTRRISGSWTDTVQNISIRGDSIIFPYRRYVRHSVRRMGDKLMMGEHYPMIYKKVIPQSIGIDSAQIKDLFLPGQWESELNYLTFSEDDLVVYDKRSKLKSKYCWDIHSLDELRFIQRKGNFDNCDYPFFALELIQKLTEDSMVIEGWTEDDFYTKTYRKSSKDLSDYAYADFQLCNPSLYENSNADWYYFKYPSFDGGLYRLQKVFDDLFQTVENGNNNGLVRVEFVINCVGDIGRFKVEELDFEYAKTNLNSAISSQVLQILKGAGKWIPGERRDQKLDTYKFLIFKVKNGRVDEIFP
jgi:hypothetical protein